MSQEPAAKRIKLNGDDNRASSGAQTPPAPNGLPDDPKSWTIEHVYRWAIEVVKVKPEHAQKLKDQEITGKSLHGMTREALERCGIPVGPAFELSEAVLKLSPSLASTHETPTSGGDTVMYIRALLVNPNDMSYRCLADVKADSGSSLELILSERKALQLGLKPVPNAPPMRARTASYSNENKVVLELVRYSEVLVIIPLGKAPTEYSIDEILALPPESKRTSLLRVLVRKTTATSATAASTATTSTSPTKEISPIKNGTDSKTNESVLLGKPGLSNLHIALHTDTNTIEGLDDIGYL